MLAARRSLHGIIAWLTNTRHLLRLGGVEPIGKSMLCSLDARVADLAPASAAAAAGQSVNRPDAGNCSINKVEGT